MTLRNLENENSKQKMELQQNYLEWSIHTQESPMHKSSSTSVTAEHTPITNQTPEVYNKMKDDY